MKNAEVNKKSELSLRIIGESLKREYAVECQLKSLCNGSITECNVDLIGNCILCTPTVHGQHKLIVTANGQEVADSPFPVFVSIHPSQLGKPVRMIRMKTGRNEPEYLAINSVGELIVTVRGCNKDVKISEPPTLRIHP